MKCKVKTSAQAFKTERNMRQPPLIFFCFLSFLLGPRVPKLTSLMHDLIARRCGGFWPQPTTPSIKYGTVAFKAMLNVPDTWGRERGGRAGRAVCAGEERGERLCWGQCFKFQIITLGLGVITADLCLTDVRVCASVFKLILEKNNGCYALC